MSAPVLAKEVHKFRKLLSLALGIAVLDGFFHTVRGVVLQEFVFDLPKRRLDRLNLRQDVDTIAAFLDHAGDSAHLAFDSPEPGNDRFRLRLMHLTYTSMGYI